MNRPIKFRGINPETGKWVYGSLFYRLQKNIKYGDKEICEILYGDHLWESVIPETLGQFTGLLDKNGKEIYEGDIIRDIHFYKPVEVVWGGNGYWTNQNGFKVMPELIYREIIGNFHENPELLGEKK